MKGIILAGGSGTRYLYSHYFFSIQKYRITKNSIIKNLKKINKNKGMNE